jgi:hypothetical protein
MRYFYRIHLLVRKVITVYWEHLYRNVIESEGRGSFSESEGEGMSGVRHNA